MKAPLNFQVLQKLGRALMLPIAVLPVAGLLLRFGAEDLLNLPAMTHAGQAIFDQLPLLFAIGVAIGFARENDGAAGLAAFVGYIVMQAVMHTFQPEMNTGVFGGIIIGVVAGNLYNRYSSIKLPEYLAFFGGKRFVPIVTGFAALIIGGIFTIIWPGIQSVLDAFGNWMIGAGSLGVFLYGVLNRLLLAFGLHHILNNLVWFQFGSYYPMDQMIQIDLLNVSGHLVAFHFGGIDSSQIVHGDMTRFMAGDPSAGITMAGFFPIMMFGLPAACYAMYRQAYDQNKKLVAGILFSLALTSLLTGVTEPIEYSFIFLAPVLFGIHAVLVGASMALMYLVGAKLGFTFSAGLIDYILFFNMDQHPLWVLIIGPIMAVIYYVLFSFFIRRFDLQTIGREQAEEAPESKSIPSDQNAWVAALGGQENIRQVDACTTRLRLSVTNNQAIDQTHLKALGAKGVLKPSAGSVQVVIGPQADQIATEIQQHLGQSKGKGSLETVSGGASFDWTATDQDTIGQQAIDKYQMVVKSIMGYLGGDDNIESCQQQTDRRCCLKVKQPLKESQSLIELDHTHFVSIIRINANTYQIFTTNAADVLAKAINQKITQ